MTLTGTTFAVISSASKTVDLAQTRVGAVLVSAAVIDDVVGLVMSSVIRGLGELQGEGGGPSLGWLIGRPIVASVAMAVLTPVLSKFILAPFFRRYIERRFAMYDHASNIALMVLVLAAFISIAAYAGTSVLFGAFLAGTFLTYLPSKHPEGPFRVRNREHGETDEDKSPTFNHTWDKYLADVQAYLIEPLFFASIGFAIPFLSLWTGEAVWKGILFSLLMVVAKFVVGIWIAIATVSKKPGKKDAKEPVSPEEGLPQEDGEKATPTQSNVSASSQGFWKSTWPPVLLLGAAMVARGEIGLLIIEIGYNESGYVSEPGFITAVWAILLNTILGPVVVGILVKYKAQAIGDNPRWGLVG